MVKFYAASYAYDYSFPAVALAYFLRYPNPYSTHVLSTDVVDRSFDPATGRLHTTRLHLKRSKIPAAVQHLLPRGFFGNGSQTQSYILETSTVDVREGRMETVSRNLEWTGVLSVMEKQVYRRVAPLAAPPVGDGLASRAVLPERTEVESAVTLKSRLGEARRLKRRRDAAAAAAAEDQRATEPEDEGSAKQGGGGFWKTWSTIPIQRSIELIAFRRTEGSQPKAKEGMKVVLERLRQGGIVAVLDGMSKDHLQAGRGSHGPWKEQLSQGADAMVTVQHEGDGFLDS
ncbi:MAG: hypothetical protein M1821_007267 [Bathelium mastoideum]|nr:MAG: hypothetical protein M1821_007267 [Bathelium mastoideum]